MVEQNSRHAVLNQVPRRNANSLNIEIITSSQLMAIMIKTMIYENKKKFAKHYTIDQGLDRILYLSNPYS